MIHTKRKMEISMTLIQLQDMPDEILLKTFKYLDRKNLLTFQEDSEKLAKMTHCGKKSIFAEKQFHVNFYEQFCKMVANI